MLDYQKIVKNLKNYGLGEQKEPSLRSYLQSISETLSKLRASSKSDQRRVEIAQQHVKEVKKHVRRLEEHVTMLEEQVQMLEEKAQKRLRESQYTLFSVSGETPKDVADAMKRDMDITVLTLDNFQEIASPYLTQSGVLDDEWPDWEDAVWAELTADGVGMYEDKK
jgi:cell division protein FtsB